MSTVLKKKFFDLWRKDESQSYTKGLAFFCASRAGCWAQDLQNLVFHDQFEALCAFRIDYNIPVAFTITELRYARQCLSFYNKDSDLSLCDTERAGWNSFAKNELQNRITNKRWSTMFQTGELFTCDDGIFLHIARKISEILGDCPALSDLKFAFGPGSNANVKQKTGARYKLQARPACSKDMVPILLELAQDSPEWLLDIHGNIVDIDIIPGRLSFVDKNAFTKRSILIEPNLCTYAQKGVGREMKERLLRFGCNLYDQSINQMLALSGSINDDVATLDEKEASNSMCLLVVYHLLTYLNEDWVNLLLSLRCGSYEYKDKVYELEMFSSMGNGFTFELESLLFYATALVVAERLQADISKVSVYGDDIIVPVECVTLLSKTLRTMGFQQNVDKSFSSGPFRESCGHDYYKGQNIRPFYKKERWSWSRVVGLLNYDLRNFNLFYDLRLSMISAIPLHLVHFGPDGYGDGHIITDDVDQELFLKRFPLRSRRARKVLGDRPGKYFNTFVKVPLRDDEILPIGDRLFPLYDIYEKPSLRLIDIKLRDHMAVPHYLTEESDEHTLLNCVDWVVRDFRNISNGASDPYVLRGGWKSKLARVYMLS